MGLQQSSYPGYVVEPASSVKLSQVDSYLNDYPEISQERKCHIASYKLFKVFLFGSPITPAVEFVGKLFVPALVQQQQQPPATEDLSRAASPPSGGLKRAFGSDGDLAKSGRASTPPRPHGAGESITTQFLEPIRISLINLRNDYAARAVLYPNLLPYSNVLVSDASAVLVRQYMQRTLTDRLYTQPTLTETLKLWILYQLVCALAQLHALGRVHGDLKTENVFVVGGSEQVMLGDLGSFGVLKPDTLPAGEEASAVFSLFFATATGIAPPGGDLPGLDREVSQRGYLSRNRCYIAPERFRSDADSSGGLGIVTGRPVFSPVQQRYDSFSLGCCAAEIFSADHSHTIFDLPDALRMHSLVRGGGRPDKESESHVAQATQHVHNPRIRKLITSLISLDPASRPLPASLLAMSFSRADQGDGSNEPLFPVAFGEGLLTLNMVMQSNPIYMAADMRIDLIAHNLPYLILMLVPRDLLLQCLRRMHYLTVTAPSYKEILSAVTSLVSDGCPDIDTNTLSAVYESSQTQQMSFFQNQQEYVQRPEAVNGDQTATPHYDPLACGGLDDGKKFPHPTLRPSCCKAFYGMLLSLWRRSAEAHCQGGKVEADWEEHLSGNMSELMLTLFPKDPIVPEVEVEGSDGSGGDRDILSILISIITSAGHAGSHPRTRQVSLMMLGELLLPPFGPYTAPAFEALRSLVAAMECVPYTADASDESLYASGQLGGVADTGAVYTLFVDYLWPVLLSLIATRSDANLLAYSAHAAVRLAQLSVTIGEMASPSGNSATSLPAIKAAMRNFVATYLQQVFQRAPPGTNFSARTPSGRVVSSTSAGGLSPDPAQLPPRAAEAVKLAVLEALPKFASLLPPCSQTPESMPGSGGSTQGNGTLTPWSVVKNSHSLRAKCDIPDCSAGVEAPGRSTPDRGLTFPYLMCFLNDPSPQVRVAFCRLAPECASVLGAFVADVALLPGPQSLRPSMFCGIVFVIYVSDWGRLAFANVRLEPSLPAGWLYYTQTLSKDLGDDRLTLSALHGATSLLEDYKRPAVDDGPNSVHRESVMRFAESAVPYLCHPNAYIHSAAKKLLCGTIREHIGDALQYIYLRRRSFNDLKNAPYLPKGWRCFGDLEGLCPVPYELVLGDQAEGGSARNEVEAARVELAKKFYRAGAAGHGGGFGEPAPVSTSGPIQIIRVPISNPNVQAIYPYYLIAEADAPLAFEGDVNRLQKDWRARHLLLPPPRPALGTLNRLDGSQETLYVSKRKLQIVNEIRGVLGNDADTYGMYGHRRVRAQRLHLHCRAGVDPPSLTELTHPSGDNVASSVGLGGGNRSNSTSSGSSISVGSLQSASTPVGETEHAESNDSSGYSLATPSTWRPGGFLIGTIYDFEYDLGGDSQLQQRSSYHPMSARGGAAHTAPVVAVDASDDGRLIFAMGGNGQLRAWRGHILEEDIAPTSSKVVSLPDEELEKASLFHYNFPMKALRNCKSVAVGGATPALYVYRMDSLGNDPVVTLRVPRPRTVSSSLTESGGIAAVESLDTDVENIVLAANQHGSVFAFDIRAGRCVFSVIDPARPVGVPTSILCSSDGRTTVLGTRSGFVRLFDVRYLSYHSRTYKLHQDGAGAGILPVTMMCNSLQDGNKSFWIAEGTRGMVALYDFVNAADGDIRPTKLLHSTRPQEPISLPVLTEVTHQPRQNFVVGADVLTQRIKEGADPNSLTVRSMLEISASRGGPWTLLTTGNDAVVRYWQPQGAGYAIPFSSEPPSPPIQLGGVQVMNSPPRSTEQHASDEGGGGGEMRVNDGHRDAVLDMCVFSSQSDVLVTAGRDGLIKMWR
ncbi:phosphoinositide-3-kinase, regulatory subunit 4 [Perkinsus chesapeaki]|uniref:Phosphoinositide-3-kinase, regulatory subunit 4 n=1 Tax=Perkinsus chesapeaki TaxID=330153 RepID=A0A7J6MCY7_PERCH|nr:phosphoinositide-3-kinase, regulatory subunit 4 [Perkinsus chesapeaki]